MWKTKLFCKRKFILTEMENVLKKTGPGQPWLNCVETETVFPLLIQVVSRRVAQSLSEILLIQSYY